MAKEIRFVLNGKARHLSRREVESCMRDVRPERIQKHAAEVGGVLYPVKQVFEAAIGVDRLDFQTDVARRKLGELGFELRRVSN